MKSLSDKEVLLQAENYKWDEYVITISGKVRRFGLVFVRQYDKNPTEDIQFCTIEDKWTPEEIGKRLEENWEHCKRPNEPSIKYIRFVEIPGLGEQHIMIRMAASGDKGELFRCVRCSCVRQGYPDLHNQNPLKLPYALHAPIISGRKEKDFRKSVDAWNEFHKPCPGENQ